MKRIAAFIFVAFSLTAFAQGTLSDRQIADIIVRDSRAAYHATGHPCACPDDLARNGSRCGGRSAYSRPGGAEPMCSGYVNLRQIISYGASPRNVSRGFSARPAFVFVTFRHRYLLAKAGRPQME